MRYEVPYSRKRSERNYELSVALKHNIFEMMFGKQDLKYNIVGDGHGFWECVATGREVPKHVKNFADEYVRSHFR